MWPKKGGTHNEVFNSGTGLEISSPQPRSRPQGVYQSTQASHFTACQRTAGDNAVYPSKKCILL